MLTALYQFTNSSGRLYVLACARRSSTSLGKTDSNSLRVVVFAILIADFGSPLFKSCS